MNLKEIEKAVGKIQAQLFKNSNSFSIGMLKSHFRGAGLQFKEHQIYNPGDDVRFIDWNLSAKTNKTYVKTFEEDRNVEINVIVDTNKSMLLGHNRVSKLQASLEIACLLYLLAERTNDLVRVYLNTKEPIILDAKAGYLGITTLISTMQKKKLIDDNGQLLPSKFYNNSLENKKRLIYLKSLAAKGKEIIYLTDFDEIEEMDVISKLSVRKNVNIFKVASPLEISQKRPFSFYGDQGGKTTFITTYSDNIKNEKAQRWFHLPVDERYLDQFVKEMSRR